MGGEEKIALGILQKAVLDLFHLVECMMPRLHEPAEIAFSGGVLENSERLGRLIKDHIVAAFPNALFPSVVCDASKGAALLALEAIEGE